MHFSPIVTYLTLVALYIGSADVTDAAPIEDQLDKLYFGGRWWQDGNTNAMRHSWGTGTFIVRFRGSSSLVMHMGAALAGAYYTCTVDGGPEVRLLVDNSFQKSTEASGISFSGLSSTEEHTIRCGRNNEASYGDTVVSGVALESGGELLRATDPNADNTMIRFEAIGDSITAGYKVLVPAGNGAAASDPATIANQDVFQTYIRHMADAWGTTDYQVIAKSGVSILDYGTTGIVMPLEWPCREYWAGWEGDCPSLWDFSNWQADVVTINLGTNDFAFGDPTQQQFREGYLSFLRQVRANYPNALIACIEPIQHSCNGESYPKLTGIVDGLEQAVIDMNDPKVIYYETGNTADADPWLDCTLSTQDFMDFTHPTVRGNQKFAARLLETMTDDVRKFFPSKCGGVGPTCGPGAPAPLPPPVPPVPLPPPTAVPVSSPPVTTPTPSPVANTPTTGEDDDSSSVVVCTAIPQNQLPDGTWATSDEICEKCGGADGYEWWPCDTNDPPLCQCSSGPTITTPVSSPPAPSPVSSPVFSPVPVPTPTSPTDTGTTVVCTAVPQSELPDGAWAVTDETCTKCADGYVWWPCSTIEPALCQCSTVPSSATRRTRAMLRSGKRS